MSFNSYSYLLGRDTFLDTLHTTFADHQIVVISGSDGIGKTAVLWEYTQRFSQHYQSIIWFNAATNETFLADLMTALQARSLPIDPNQGVVNLFQTLHNSMSTQRRTLLILDNFSYSFTIQESLEQQPTIRVAVITQGQQAPAEIPRLELTSLNAYDGAMLLLHQAGLLSPHETLDQAGDEEHQAALELARELRGFPIALYLVGKYLRMTGSNAQDYLTAFRDYPTPLHLTTSSDGIAMEEFAVACERSFIHLQEVNPTVFELLQIGALLLPEAIPGILFQSQTEHTSSKNGAEQEQEIIEILQDSGLVTADYNPSLLSMHRLVQDIIRQFITESKREQLIKQALGLLYQHLPVLQTETLPTRLRIASQIRHLAKISESESAFSDRSLFNEAADVFTWAATLFWEQLMISEAEALLRRALSIWERTLGNAHPTIATVLSNLATMNSLLKNYPEAEALSHRAINSKISALGIDHPDILLTLDQLGHIYAEQGKQKEARQCYEKAIAVGDTVKLRQHPLYVTVMYDLALLYMEQKSWEKAIPLLRKVCIIRTSSLGLQDQATMEAWFSLAVASIQQRNWQRAKTAYQHALPVCEKLLGEEHAITLDHLECSATVLRHLGELTEAKHNLQRVLEIRERDLSYQHLSIVPCLNGLARIALVQEQFTEALALLERAQCIYANQPEDLTFATVLDTLASIETAQQQYSQAISTYTRALELRRQILGEEHVDLVENLNNLAGLYLKRKEYHQAERHLLQALSIYQEEQRPEDMMLDPVLNGLAEVEIAREHFDMARIYLDRSRAIRELTLGHSDPRTTEVVQRLASLAKAQV